MLEFIDGDLCLLNEDEKITYVFERGDLSRAAYKHMTGWTQANFNENLSPEENWAKADRAWEALTPEHKMLLWSMSVQESQNSRDICSGLLATLSSYQGLTSVKNAFRDAINAVAEQFTSSSRHKQSA
jgi:hypothetical protein